MQPIVIADYACRTGEALLWHEDEQRLYWTDIHKGLMYRYDPATEQSELVFEGEQVGGLTLQADGTILMFGEGGSVRVWRDGIVRTIIDGIPGEEASRFNDVIADPEGRVYCGTMPSPDMAMFTPQPNAPAKNGTLYRLNLDGSLTVMVEDVTCSNGMGFTPDQTKVYFTDSRRYEIYQYDYDRSTGDWSNKRVFAEIDEQGAIPDGMTVDAEGYVWSARYGGGCVVRHAPDGSIVQRVDIPAQRVTCPLFGGPDYADLYVTTAYRPPEDVERGLAGATFRLDVGVRGVPEFRSRIGL